MGPGFESLIAYEKKKTSMVFFFSYAIRDRTQSFFYFATQKRSLCSLGGPPGPHSRSRHSLAPIRMYVRINSQLIKDVELAGGGALEGTELEILAGYYAYSTKFVLYGLVCYLRMVVLAT